MLKKYSFLYEIPLFYALLFGFNRLLMPERPGFIGFDPHPYWLGIVAFALRYGILAGSSGGIVSAILFLAANWLYGDRYLFEDLIFYTLPGLFVIGGIFIGGVTDHYRKRIAALSDAEAAAKRRESQLKEEIEVRDEIQSGLEKRIVTRMATLVTLYEGAKRLESVNHEELYPAILDFILKTLHAEEGAIFLKDPDGWKLHSSVGWQTYAARPTFLKPGEGLIGIAGSQKKVVSVRDFVTSEELKSKLPSLVGEALIAGPIKNGEDGDVIGVVAIQKIPFLEFNSASINLLSFLLTWASRAIGRASFVTELKMSEVIDPEFQVYSSSYFRSRFNQELHRSRHYYLPLTVALVSLDGLDRFKEREKLHVLTVLSSLLKQEARDMDIVARFTDPNIPFAVLFITASAAQSEAMVKAMEEKFAALGLTPPDGQPLKLRVGLGHFSPQLNEAESLLQAAKRGLS